MVTFNNAGRMGNWLFEFASSAAYSLRHGMDFTVPSRTQDPHWNPIYCTHLINQNFDDKKEKVHIWENGHHYQELPFEESYRDKNVIIEGYRQSELYFSDFRNEIIYLLDFKWEVKQGIVGVHVRRGDYLHLVNKHPPVTKEWYEQAMSMFPGMRFKFFSDDIRWCREAFGSREDCEFSTNSNEVDDMVELSCCENQIISASTFGWWGAWLNRNPEKKIIIPKLWFQPGYELDTKDIVPPEWTKL
jgi:hypothetical protein